jgi:hypothetical protein
VAKSYEFIESLERFLLDQQKHTLADAPDVPPANTTGEAPPRDNLDA